MKFQLKNKLRLAIFSAIAGVLAGFAAAVFLHALEWATQSRDKNPIVIWFLPMAGLLIGWVYHRFGKSSHRGHNLILEEIHDPKNVLPLRMAPLVLAGTVVTHFFGGSAGREGTAVQMGSTLADQLTRFFKLDSAERKVLLMAGAGAGFGAAIGAPWAGAVFGLEVIHVGRLKFFAWAECMVAAFAGYYTTLFLQAPHSKFPALEFGGFSFKILFWIAIAGIIFGLAARFFTALTHLVEKICGKWILYPPLRPFLFGALIVALFYFEGSYRYVGLGLPVIQTALVEAGSFQDPLFKAIFTALTVGSGFKGGEFIPLVFIGTTLGSALSVLLPVAFQLLAAVGFAAVFAGASNTPIACSIMAMEIFGFEIAPYAVTACFLSYFFSGYKGIYKTQPVQRKKHHIWRFEKRP